MRYRKQTHVVIFILFIVVLTATFTYGPYRRTYVVPSRTVSLDTASKIDELWHSSGLHGRTAVLFVRHLNAQFSGLAFPEMDYLGSAIRHAITRKVFYVVPDRYWNEVVSENRYRREFIMEPIATDTGFMIINEGVRIHAMPLSKYIPDPETAIVVLEKDVWSQQEFTRIEGFIRSGQLATDLAVLVSGDKQNE
jgi:hypothetical protein